MFYSCSCCVYLPCCLFFFFFVIIFFIIVIVIVIGVLVSAGVFFCVTLVHFCYIAFPPTDSTGNIVCVHILLNLPRFSIIYRPSLRASFFSCFSFISPYFIFNLKWKTELSISIATTTFNNNESLKHHLLHHYHHYHHRHHYHFNHLRTTACTFTFTTTTTTLTFSSRHGHLQESPPWIASLFNLSA